MNKTAYVAIIFCLISLILFMHVVASAPCPHPVNMNSLGIDGHKTMACKDARVLEF